MRLVWTSIWVFLQYIYVNAYDLKDVDVIPNGSKIEYKNGEKHEVQSYLLVPKAVSIKSTGTQQMLGVSQDYYDDIVNLRSLLEPSLVSEQTHISSHQPDIQYTYEIKNGNLNHYNLNQDNGDKPNEDIATDVTGKEHAQRYILENGHNVNEDDESEKLKSMKDLVMRTKIDTDPSRVITHYILEQSVPKVKHILTQHHEIITGDSGKQYYGQGQMNYNTGKNQVKTKGIKYHFGTTGGKNTNLLRIMKQKYCYREIVLHVVKRYSKQIDNLGRNGMTMDELTNVIQSICSLQGNAKKFWYLFFKLLKLRNGDSISVHNIRLILSILSHSYEYSSKHSVLRILSRIIEKTLSDHNYPNYGLGGLISNDPLIREDFVVETELPVTNLEYESPKPVEPLEVIDDDDANFNNPAEDPISDETLPDTDSPLIDPLTEPPVTISEKYHPYKISPQLKPNTDQENYFDELSKIYEYLNNDDPKYPNNNNVNIQIINPNVNTDKNHPNIDLNVYGQYSGHNYKGKHVPKIHGKPYWMLPKKNQDDSEEFVDITRMGPSELDRDIKEMTDKNTASDYLQDGRFRYLNLGSVKLPDYKNYNDYQNISPDESEADITNNDTSSEYISVDLPEMSSEMTVAVDTENTSEWNQVGTTEVSYSDYKTDRTLLIKNKVINSINNDSNHGDTSNATNSERDSEIIRIDVLHENNTNANKYDIEGQTESYSVIPLPSRKLSPDQIPYDNTENRTISVLIPIEIISDQPNDTVSKVNQKEKAVNHNNSYPQNQTLPSNTLKYRNLELYENNSESPQTINLIDNDLNRPNIAESPKSQDIYLLDPLHPSLYEVQNDADPEYGTPSYNHLQSDPNVNQTPLRSYPEAYSYNTIPEPNTHLLVKPNRINYRPSLDIPKDYSYLRPKSLEDPKVYSQHPSVVPETKHLVPNPYEMTTEPRPYPTIPDYYIISKSLNDLRKPNTYPSNLNPKLKKYPKIYNNNPKYAPDTDSTVNEDIYNSPYLNVKPLEITQRPRHNNNSPIGPYVDKTVDHQPSGRLPSDLNRFEITPKSKYNIPTGERNLLPNNYNIYRQPEANSNYANHYLIKNQLENKSKLKPYDVNIPTNIINYYQRYRVNPQPYIETNYPDLSPRDQPNLDPRDKPNLEPREYPNLVPIDEPNLDPRDEPNLDPRDYPNLVPIDEPNLDPRDYPNLVPIDEPNLDPRDYPNLVPKYQPDLEPRDEPNLDPRDHPNLDPRDEPNLDPRDYTNLVPLNEPNLAPIDKPNLGSIDEPNLDPRDYSNLNPRDNPKLVPIGEPNLDPRDEPNLEPRDYPYLVPINEPNLDQRDYPNLVPIDEPNLDPRDEPNLDQRDYPNLVPIDELNLDPRDYPNLVPINKPYLNPKYEPDLVPLNEPNLVPIDKPNLGPIDEPNLDPRDKPNLVPINEPHLVPINEPNLVPIDEPYLDPRDISSSIIQPSDNPSGTNITTDELRSELLPESIELSPDDAITIIEHNTPNYYDIGSSLPTDTPDEYYTVPNEMLRPKPHNNPIDEPYDPNHINIIYPDTSDEIPPDYQYIDPKSNINNDETDPKIFEINNPYINNAETDPTIHKIDNPYINNDEIDPQIFEINNPYINNGETDPKIFEINNPYINKDEIDPKIFGINNPYINNDETDPTIHHINNPYINNAEKDPTIHKINNPYINNDETDPTIHKINNPYINNDEIDPKIFGINNPYINNDETDPKIFEINNPYINNDETDPKIFEINNPYINNDETDPTIHHINNPYINNAEKDPTIHKINNPYINNDETDPTIHKINNPYINNDETDPKIFEIDNPYINNDETDPTIHKINNPYINNAETDPTIHKINNPYINNNETDPTIHKIDNPYINNDETDPKIFEINNPYINNAETDPKIFEINNPYINNDETDPKIFEIDNPYINNDETDPKIFEINNPYINNDETDPKIFEINNPYINNDETDPKIFEIDNPYINNAETDPKIFEIDNNSQPDSDSIEPNSLEILPMTSTEPIPSTESYPTYTDKPTADSKTNSPKSQETERKNPIVKSVVTLYETPDIEKEPDSSELEVKTYHTTESKPDIYPTTKTPIVKTPTTQRAKIYSPKQTSNPLNSLLKYYLGLTKHSLRNKIQPNLRSQTSSDYDDYINNLDDAKHLYSQDITGKDTIKSNLVENWSRNPIIIYLNLIRQKDKVRTQLRDEELDDTTPKCETKYIYVTNEKPADSQSPQNNYINPYTHYDNINYNRGLLNPYHILNNQLYWNPYMSNIPYILPNKQNWLDPYQNINGLNLNNGIPKAIYRQKENIVQKPYNFKMTRDSENSKDSVSGGNELENFVQSGQIIVLGDELDTPNTPQAELNNQLLDELKKIDKNNTIERITKLLNSSIEIQKKVMDIVKADQSTLSNSDFFRNILTLHRASVTDEPNVTPTNEIITKLKDFLRQNFKKICDLKSLPQLFKVIDDIVEGASDKTR